MAHDWKIMKEAYSKVDEFRIWFKENFIRIVTESDYLNAYDIGSFCKYSDVRELVFQNLDLVLSKMTSKSDFLQFMDLGERRKNLEKFFEGKKIDDDMKKCFYILLDEGVLNSNKALEILANKIEETYNEIGLSRVYDIMNIIPCFLIISENNPNMKKIDEFLTSKFEDICDADFGLYKFKFKYFNKFENFKKEIQKKGPEFFMVFPIDYTISLEECREIAKDIFGDFTSDIFSKMKYGYKNPTKASIIKMIIDELLKRADNSKNMDAVKQVGEGFFSVAYRIGDKVFKVGKRANPVIQNHRRILQPIVRRKIGDEYDEDNFIEIQNLVDTSWYKKMKSEDIHKVLLNIYSELRDDGLVWVDVKPENIGKLLRPNTTHEFDLRNKEINPPERATGIIGKNKGEPLQAGEYVIIDSDLIYEEKEWSELVKNNYFGELCRERKYEEEYQARKNKDEAQL